MNEDPSETKKDLSQRQEGAPSPSGADDAWEAEEDPTVVKIVRKALAPYKGRVSPERLAEYRKLLILFITTHPSTSQRLRRLRPDPVVATSTEMAKEGAEVVEFPKARTGGMNGE